MSPVTLFVVALFVIVFVCLVGLFASLWNKALNDDQTQAETELYKRYR